MRVFCHLIGAWKDYDYFHCVLSTGERLNKLYREGVDEAQILGIVSPLIQRFAVERQSPAEHFGDFLVRVGVIAPTLSGRTFHN
jgi:sulfite reductase (NADPH) hemoprotein beta-component